MQGWDARERHRSLKNRGAGGGSKTARELLEAAIEAMRPALEDACVVAHDDELRHDDLEHSYFNKAPAERDVPVPARRDALDCAGHEGPHQSRAAARTTGLQSGDGGVYLERDYSSPCKGW